jgi:hypothetical protein
VVDEASDPSHVENGYLILLFTHIQRQNNGGIDEEFLGLQNTKILQIKNVTFTVVNVLMSKRG